MNKYWMVHRIGSPSSNVQHKSLDSATEEAKRLAAQHPGSTFAVLETVTAWHAPQPFVQRIEVMS